MPRALITGGSAGIGAAIATELARRGTDLVLVARDEMRLRRLADDFAAAHGIDAEVLSADLLDAEDLARVEKRLAGEPEIDLLVDNAGIGSYGALADLRVDGEERIVRLNVLAMLRLAHTAARVMRSRGRGSILLVSSMSGFQALPGNATYSASKAFVTSFGQALHEELRPCGVHVTTLCPSYTRTEFHERAGMDTSGMPRLFWQDAATVARAGIDGVAARRAVVVPGLRNRLVATVSRMAPLVASRRVGARLNNRLRPRAEPSEASS
jgi:short-subunit dehydrogenase